jgi:predicted short-subunit dehydrogenase-like oxidoreductase (DUF2520 family)
MRHWRIGIVSAGRVGAALGSAWQQAGHTITAVSGESDASRSRIAELLPGIAVTKPSAVARSCELLLLTVPDDMLPNVVTVLSDSGAITDRHTVVHTSGRHGLAVLAPARQVGARTIALHPAMTFTGTRRDLARLRGCVYAITAAAPDRLVAEQLVANLDGLATWIDEEHRGLYHAALAHGANHLVTLVSQAIEILESAGSNNATETLRPLLSAALDNALKSRDDALTGPIVRGDAQTVQAHVEELLANAPHTLPSYVALAHATLDRVVTDGRVVPMRAARIRRILDHSLERVPLV